MAMSQGLPSFQPLPRQLPFSSSSRINLVLPILIFISSSLLKRQDACLLGIERGETEGQEKSFIVN